MGKGRKNVKHTNMSVKNVFCLSLCRAKKAKNKRSKPVTSNLKQLNLKTREGVRDLNKKDVHVQVMPSKTKKDTEKHSLKNSAFVSSSDIDTVMGEMKRL